jgi:type II secretory pathway pseudopilin PulG
MRKSLKFLLQQSHQTRKISGFTLTELLVGMAMASLVITPLFSFALNIMESDRKEQAKATTEQEIQSALDYIAQDLEQAIYIYDADGLNNSSADSSSGIKDQIPPVSAASGCGSSTPTCVPVLVFWKREHRPGVLPVSGSSLKDDAFVYSLVAYYLIKSNSSTWSSAARIGRFEIKDGVRNPTSPTNSDGTPNFITNEPTSTGFQLFDLSVTGSSLKEKMNRWKKASGNYTTNVLTLIDYVDHSILTPQACPTGMQRVPSTETLPGGFYTCVDSATTSAQVYIRGNALARLGNNSTFSTNQAAYFPSATIQVKGRGFLGVE